ncbi:MAG TPA: hypothetical protein VJ044_14390, partial [Candidatus Hodarchaeales archaeon]|nr:hypothetical protein [Candidatus Hodarchaeales archaeon]
ENKVVRVVDFLVNSSLVSRASDESLRVTNLGKRVASLYVDPLTAQRLISGVLQSIGKDKFPAITEFSFLHLFATVPDMQRLRIKASDFDALEQMAKESEQTFLTEMPTSHDVRYERLLMEVQTARILVLWIEEADPQKILDSGRIDLGDLNRLIDTSNWIAYSCRSLARELRETARRSSDIKLTVLSTLDLDPQIILNRLHYLESFLESLEIRLKYGIRSDLTKLIQVKYIGRVRARALAEAGITFEDLPNCTLERLSTIRSIGSGIAKLILSQAVGPSDDDEEQYSAPTEVKRKAAFSMRKKRIEEFFN